MMNLGKQMPSKGMPAQDDDMMGEEAPEEGADKDSMGSKLLAMQNILDNLGDIVGEDMKPFIEQAKQSMHMQHEQAEGDEMGVQNEQEHEMGEDGQPKAKLDVAIGVGGKPSMGEESEDEDESMPKKGFLAILAKRMKNK
jgi:hypothetical protein